jgi:hypothetical protein
MVFYESGTAGSFLRDPEKTHTFTILPVKIDFQPLKKSVQSVKFVVII